MKKGLCQTLAVGNIRKNYRFFIPRILAETGLLACFYIIFTLACDSRLASVKGGDYLPTFMWMGAVIIGLLSAILMLYTGSFLMKQRKREFGLYSVLGMEKKHVCRVLFHESFLCSVVSVILGLLCGILFYKLCSLGICKLLKADIVAGFYFITPKTVIPSGLIFLGIDALVFLFNLVSIRRTKPVDLLSGANVGEKEPKVKWLLLVLGVVFLAGGYAISLSTKNPLQAILLFFAAVLAVMAGTYFLYIAGSIFLLKILKKRDGYYYKPGHMTSVSGLLYRMKQNAVGLASVAILATGVLVMISSTFCLYSRTEGVLNQNYPQDFYLTSCYDDADGTLVRIPENVIEDTVRTSAENNGLKVKEGFFEEFFYATFLHKPGQLITDREAIDRDMDISELCNITFITEEMYVKLGGEPLGLRDNEVAVSPFNVTADFADETFSLGGKTYTVAKKLMIFPVRTALISVNCFGFVVADDSAFSDIFAFQKEAYGEDASALQCRYSVTFTDRGRALDAGHAFAGDVIAALSDAVGSQAYADAAYRDYDSVWDAHESLYGMYGTLLFLGILLGIVCLFATVLIIYYKQISEGYEDRNRYQIMQKIGMTEREVKKTIRSQITLVFFLPLVTAGVHVAFAYPILTKLMEILLLDDVWLFAKWCAVVYVVFALVYALIYKLTAKTYYKIVY